MTGPDAASKWSRNLGNATQDIRAGVQAVTQSPTEAAASEADLWQQRMQQDQTKARFIAGLRRVTLADWKAAMIDKGLARVAAGASAAVGKMGEFLTEFLPHVYAGAESVRKMPKLTLEDGIQRATAMIRHNATFTRKG
jgi:hypothetical protein